MVAGLSFRCQHPYMGRGGGGSPIQRNAFDIYRKQQASITVIFTKHFTDLQRTLLGLMAPNQYSRFSPFHKQGMFLLTLTGAEGKGESWRTWSNVCFHVSGRDVRTCCTTRWQAWWKDIGSLYNAASVTEKYLCLNSYTKPAAGKKKKKKMFRAL